jgi:uncharacterized protein (TIGR03435 family)
MMMIRSLAEWAIRSSILILFAAVLLWLLRVTNPSVRLTVWTTCLAASLAIPLLTTILPKLPVTVMRAPARPHTVPAPAISDSAAVLSLPVIPVSTLTPPRTAAVKPFDWMRFVAMVYAVAAAALLMRLSVGFAVSLRMFRRSRPTAITSEGADVRESDGVASPVTIGVLRPAVLLPPDWRGWDSAKLDAVLAHERSHIRRHDPAVQFVSAIHRALLWASPASWFLDRSIVRTAEQASDDAAVAATRDRVSYAEILLEFVQRGAGQTAGLGVPMARYESPEKRIRRILHSTALPHEVTRWGVAAILALGAPVTYLAAAAHPQASPLPAPLPAPVALAPAPAPTPSPAPARAPVQAAAPPLPVSPNPRPDSLPAFEVASVQPADLNSGHLCCITIHPGARVEIHAVSLKSLITTAYRLSGFQTSGGDAWTEKDTYDIEAKPPADSLSSIKTLRYTWYGIEDEHLRQMLQALLIDRFQLKFHRETKTGDVYLLQQSGKPLGLRHTEGPFGGADPEGFGSIGYVAARWSFFAFSMPQLAKFAADFILHVPVLDRTELTGPFDYKQRQPDLEPNYGPDQTDTFLRFMQEVGLKLERSKGPVEYLVIDSAARPSAN